MGVKLVLLVCCGFCFFQWSKAGDAQHGTELEQQQFATTEADVQNETDTDNTTTTETQNRVSNENQANTDSVTVQLNRLYVEQNKMSTRVLPSEFSCEVRHSSTIPTSVHTLWPGDIQVIGAMGDSLTAGTGVSATSVIGEVIQNRGLSWSGGGEGTFEKHITLPNILKKYNPKLYGYATGDGNVDSVRAHFNVAVIGSTSSDLKKQARVMVDRMKNDPFVDFVNDWKVVTILSGNNDLCNSCLKPEKYNEGQYYGNLVKALDILHKELPRTLVNLVEPARTQMVQELNKGLFCSALHGFMCSCGAFPEDKAAQLKVEDLTSRFQSTVKEIALSGRYDTRDDFTVVYQPFFNASHLPRRADGQPDLSYFAPDCFHLSSKGEATIALALWNNMITPLQDKEPTWLPHGRKALLRCPSEDEPFIYTNRNSQPPQTPSPAAPYSDNFRVPRYLLTVAAVSGVTVITIGAAVIVAVIRRYRLRNLYIQIPPE